MEQCPAGPGWNTLCPGVLEWKQFAVANLVMTTLVRDPSAQNAREMDTMSRK